MPRGFWCCPASRANGCETDGVESMDGDRAARLSRPRDGVDRSSAVAARPGATDLRQATAVSDARLFSAVSWTQASVGSLSARSVAATMCSTDSAKRSTSRRTWSSYASRPRRLFWRSPLPLSPVDRPGGRGSFEPRTSVLPRPVQITGRERSARFSALVVMRADSSLEKRSARRAMVVVPAAQARPAGAAGGGRARGGLLLRLRPKGGFGVQIIYGERPGAGARGARRRCRRNPVGLSPSRGRAWLRPLLPLGDGGEGRGLAPYFDPQTRLGTEPKVHDLFSLEGRVAVVTGGSGALGSTACAALAAGAAIGVLARDMTRIDAIVAEIARCRWRRLSLPALLDIASLERRHDIVLERRGRLDVLVNAAGGNLAGGDRRAWRDVLDLPRRRSTQSSGSTHRDAARMPGLGQALARSGDQVTGRCIVNISSMAADRALTRVARLRRSEGGGRRPRLAGSQSTSRTASATACA